MWSESEKGVSVDKTELEKLKDPELRALAKKAGVTELLGRDELIARLLAEEPPAPAKKEAKPAKESKETVSSTTRAFRPPRAPSRGTFDVPSSTVYPHADELETLVMARRYLAEGQAARALEIYEKLAALDPDDAKLAAELADARKKLPKPVENPPPAPEAPQEPLWMLDLEELPDTYGVDFVQPTTIGRVVLQTLDSTKYPAAVMGVRDFDVRLRNNGVWTTMEEVRGNTTGRLVFTFEPRAVDAVQLVIHDSNDHGYSRIVELEAYAN